MSHTAFIVTGGAGFIGCNLVHALNARGHGDITVVDDLNHLEKQRNLEGMRFSEYVDKRDFRARFLAGKQPDVATVFHLGACSSTTQLDEAYLEDNNVRYTRELCKWALARGAHFVYASSAATYGDGSLGYSDSHEQTPGLRPLNPYGRSKQAFDMWALEEGLLSNRIVGIKYFNVYGPFEEHKGDMRSVVNKAFRQICDTGVLRLFRSHRDDYRDGEQIRDFVYVKDAVAVTLFFHDHPGLAGLYNCGTGKARTWNDLGRAVFAAMDLNPRIEYVDMPGSIRERYQYHTQADTEKLRAAGYAQPFTPLEGGIGDYVRNYLSADMGAGKSQ